MNQKHQRLTLLAISSLIIIFANLTPYVAGGFSIEYIDIEIDGDSLNIEEYSLERGDEARFTWENMSNRTHTIVLREGTDFNFTLLGFEATEFTITMNYDPDTTLHFDISNCDKDFVLHVIEYVPPSFWEDQASLTLLATISLCVIIILVAFIIIRAKKRKEKKTSLSREDSASADPIIGEVFDAGSKEVNPLLLREIKRMRELKGKPATAEEIGEVLDTTIITFKNQLAHAPTRAMLTVRDELKFIIVVNRQMLALNRHLSGRVRDLEIEQEGFYRRMSKMGESMVVAGGIDLTNKPLNWDTGFKKVWNRYKMLFIFLGIFIVLLGVFLALYLVGRQEDPSLVTRGLTYVTGWFT